ncbi:ABC-type glycerol-3-phosphate transport system substrate-binding protein [Anaerobacterium chartisolvens]|uniref:ABC-type glycerol-3-phosphate transport system substrate-binding protein n=1 Tax=Anaerobacterium chartisolvens TaxID=1297424 RepID=A0A369AYQ1_9FIRM|nr:ABC transporter substrate-binding protein [Anaerobacterium chartisolvens]RCX14293.1 ABC-type glycerol-3-phosphate transport system substrate-binding protein [Anaerobacterium chartisolvens]
MKKFNKNFMVVILIIAAVTSGCTNSGTGSLSETDEKEMKMYVESWDQRIPSALNEFNTGSPVKISPIWLSDEKDYEQYRQKITASILSGDGPDIILDKPSRIPGLWKIVENNAFYDLDILIKEDKEFNLSDYNKSILDCGIINGKRYLMPLYFSLPLIWSPKSTLANNQLKYNLNPTWDYMKELAESCGEQKKYLIGGSFSFTSLIKNYWPVFIDLVNKRVNFDSPEFIRLLEVYRQICPAICPDEELKPPDFWYRLFRDGQLYFFNGQSLVSLNNLWEENSAVRNFFDSEICIFSYPAIEGQQGITAEACEFVGINQTTDFKNEAFKFIKLLMSEKYQNYGAGVNTFWAPINKKAYEQIKKECTGKEASGKRMSYYLADGQKEYISVAIPEELIKKMDSYIDSISECIFIDTNILDFIDQEVQAYIAGKQDARQTAKAIDNKVRLYMDE